LKYKKHPVEQEKEGNTFSLVIGFCTLLLSNSNAASYFSSTELYLDERWYLAETLAKMPLFQGLALAEAPSWNQLY